MNSLFIYHNPRTKSDPVDLERHISNLGEVLSREESFWIIQSEKTPGEARIFLEEKFDGWDPFIVGTAGPTLSAHCWGSDDIRRMEDFFNFEE